MPINKEKLEARAKVAKSRPDFKRPESWRYKRLETTWRKPKGIDNHQRKQKSRGRPGLVKVGYGGPKISRGLHPSCLLYTSPSPRDKRQSRMPSSA